MHICTSITFIETSANKFRWKLIIYPHKYLLAVGETGGWIERRTASGKQNLRPLGRLQSVIFKCLSYQTDVNISLWIHKPIIHWQVSINHLFLINIKNPYTNLKCPATSISQSIYLIKVVICKSSYQWYLCTVFKIPASKSFHLLIFYINV